MFLIILYHGTIVEYANDILKEGIDLSKSNRYLDFGPGFYTTPELRFAEETAKITFASRKRLNPVGYAVVVLELRDDCLGYLNQRIFFFADSEWARFVIANRCKNDNVRIGVLHNFDAKYDLVTGCTADGKRGSLTVLATDVSEGKRTLASITDHDVYPSSVESWGTQWSFHTSKSLSCLSLKDVIYYKC